MRIAVLCWGSLYWARGCLKLNSDEWEADGPELPLEFCRISSAGKPNERVTLVINKEGNVCTTYWQIHKYQNLDDAKENLREREGCKNIERIGSIKKGEKCSEQITKSIHSWLLEKSNIDAVIWTNLESNWSEKRGEDFSIESLRKYLEESKDKSHWEEIVKYFKNAPSQTKTAGRKLFEKEFESRDAN